MLVCVMPPMHTTTGLKHPSCTHRHSIIACVLTHHYLIMARLLYTPLPHNGMRSAHTTTRLWDVSSTHHYLIMVRLLYTPLPHNGMRPVHTTTRL